jgi:hypothetical protein
MVVGPCPYNLNKYVNMILSIWGRYTCTLLPATMIRNMVRIEYIFLGKYFKGSVSRNFLGPFLAFMDRSRSV